MTETTILFAIVLLAGFYMAWNIGANDVANAIGTSVGSGALTLMGAVIIAAILEFSGALLFGSSVTSTIQTGIVDPALYENQPMHLLFGMLSALIAAGVWLQIASYFGWPVSTTHTIIGAVAGFGLISIGPSAVNWKQIIFIVLGWLISPVAGGIIAFAAFSILRKKILFNPQPVLAAKRITPIYIFVFIFVMAFVVLHKMHLNLNGWETVGISLLAGGGAALIAALLLHKLSYQLHYSKSSAISPEMVHALNEARKHLKELRKLSAGKLDQRLNSVLQELRGLPLTLENPHDDSVHIAYQRVENIFRYLQIVSACMMAFSHGANDVANAIGPLAACLSILTTGHLSMSAHVPVWILALGGIGIVIGLATWGWRVIETVGRKITDLTPSRGFSAEFGAATTIMVATSLGLPISTTHTLVGSVIGVGMARGIESLDLSTTRNIVISWIVTVPAGVFLVLVFYELILWSYSIFS